MKGRFAAKARRALAGAMIPATLLAAVLSAPTPALADDTADAYRQKMQEAQNALDEVNKQIDAVQEDRANAVAQRDLYQEQQDLIIGQIDLINGQIAEIAAQIDEKEAEIIAKQGEIDVKQAEFDSRWNGFKDRMAGMQMLNDGGSIALLSSATNLYELLTFSQTLEDIASRDEEICHELEAQRAELNAQKQQLEDIRAELEANEASLEDQQIQLDDKQQQLAANIQAQNADISEADAMEQALEQTQTELEAAFNEAAEAYSAYLAEQNRKYGDASLTCSLDFICPVATYRRVSCQFGAGGHRGVDLAAPAWTEIYAVADGRVTAAGWHNHATASYGNYVQILHGTASDGNVYSTLYAHMIQTPNVKEGDMVTRGQVIGYVGSTGYSTGNHLHFELKINNALTNPLPWIPH